MRRVLSLRAVPTTPASHPEPGGCPGPGYSGLPRVRVGSALATALSGPAQGSLAFGPQICWPSFRGLLSGRLDVLQLPEDRPPVATRLNRQLPRQDSHLQERATFARRTLTISGSWVRDPFRRRVDGADRCRGGPFRGRPLGRGRVDADRLPRRHGRNGDRARELLVRSTTDPVGRSDARSGRDVSRRFLESGAHHPVGVEAPDRSRTWRAFSCDG